MTDIQNKAKVKRAGIRLKTSPLVKPQYAMLCVLPATVVIILASVVPACVVLGLTFTNFEGSFAATDFVGMENWISFFNGTIGGSSGGAAALLDATWVTLEYSLLVIIPMQILALLSAVVVNRKLYHTSGFFRALFFLPNILGVTVVTTIWNIIFSTNNGPVYQFTQWIGWNTSLLGDRNLSIILVSIATVWAGFGFSMAIYLSGLQGIEKDYYEAADVDGAGTLQKFFRITLPLLVPSITICLWVSLNSTLHVSDYIYLMTNGAAHTTTLGFFIFDRIINNKLTYGQSSVISLVFFVFVALIMNGSNSLMKRLEAKYCG